MSEQLDQRFATTPMPGGGWAPIGFGEPGDERPVHFGTAPDRAIIDKPLGDKELVSIRFPDELPDGGVTARVFLDDCPGERQEEPR